MAQPLMRASQYGAWFDCSKIGLMEHPTDQLWPILRRTMPTKTEPNPTVVKLSYGAVGKYQGSPDCVSVSMGSVSHHELDHILGRSPQGVEWRMATFTSIFSGHK